MGGYLHAQPAVIHVTSDGKHASLLCLLRSLPGGLSLASAYPYGCIDGDPRLFWEAIPAITRALKRVRAVRLEIPFTGMYIAQLQENLSTRMPRVPRSLNAVRHVLDLDPGEGCTLEQRFDPKIRWATRKAVRSGCVIRHATAADVSALQSLYARTMHAKNAPVNYGPERWAGLLAELEPISRGCIYLGEVEGRPCGMAAVVDGSMSRHLIQLAVPPEAHSLRLSELLVATAMQDARLRGQHYFDFMASSSNDTGLIAFKAKWGTTAEAIRHVVIPGMPVLHHAITFARWANRTRARFHAP